MQARAFPAQPLLEHLELEALPAYTNLAEVPISTPTEESTKKTSQETPFDPGKKCFLLNLTRKPRVGSINCLHQPHRGSNPQAKTEESTKLTIEKHLKIKQGSLPAQPY